MTAIASSRAATCPGSHQSVGVSLQKLILDGPQRVEFHQGGKQGTPAAAAAAASRRASADKEALALCFASYQGPGRLPPAASRWRHEQSPGAGSAPTRGLRGAQRVPGFNDPERSEDAETKGSPNPLGGCVPTRNGSIPQLMPCGGRFPIPTGIRGTGGWRFVHQMQLRWVIAPSNLAMQGRGKHQAADQDQ